MFSNNFGKKGYKLKSEYSTTLLYMQQTSSYEANNHSEKVESWIIFIFIDFALFSKKSCLTFII